MSEAKHTPGPWIVEDGSSLVTGGGLMSKLLEACQFFRSHLDYLRDTWGDEGITRRVRDRLDEAIQDAEQPVSREWLLEVLGPEEGMENHWKIQGAVACFLIAFHDVHRSPFLAIATVQSGIHPVCDIPAESRAAFVNFMELVGIEL